MINDRTGLLNTWWLDQFQVTIAHGKVKLHACDLPFPIQFQLPDLNMTTWFFCHHPNCEIHFRAQI